MEDLIFLIVAGLLILLQLMSCIFAKNTLLRLMPFLISIALTILCISIYLIGDQTNWAYIILTLLLGIVLLFQSVIILVNHFIRQILKF